MSLTPEASRLVREAHLELYVLAAELYARRLPAAQVRTVRERLDRQLRTQRQVLAPILSPRGAEAVQLAAVALIDEAARHWLGEQEAHVWESFQFELYQQETLGTRFFQELDRLKGDPQTPVEVLEVYFRCLCLGFKGEFAPSRLAELAQVQQGLDNHLQRLMPPAPPLAPLFEDVQAAPRGVPFLKVSQTLLLAAGLISVLALFSSLSLRLESRSTAEALKRALEAPEPPAAVMTPGDPAPRPATDPGGMPLRPEAAGALPTSTGGAQ